MIFGGILDTACVIIARLICANIYSDNIPLCAMLCKYAWFVPSEINNFAVGNNVSNARNVHYVLSGELTFGN